MTGRNDHIRDYLGVTAWHEAGYTGSRVVMATCETWDNTHGRKVWETILEMAPDARLVYIQSPSGAVNSTFFEDAASHPEICVATSSLIIAGNSDGREPIDRALDGNPWLTFCFAAGNDGELSYNPWIDCRNIWGVGAVSLVWSRMTDGKPDRDAVCTVVPAYYSSLAEAVDFCAPVGVVSPLSGMGFSGTSCASPVLAGLCAVVNDYFMAMTGAPLKREAMYRFLTDCAADVYLPGKDTKTGLGLPILPPVESVDAAKYIGGDGVIQSRDIDELRPDVAANCREFIARCAALGYKVGVSCTYRDQEYQTYLHQRGIAPATVTFHGARLAFDIFQNVKGKEYENAFFDAVAPVAKALGFSWMWDIAHNEKCHFQWDCGRTYKNADILSGRLPPDMPTETEDDMDIGKLTDLEVLALWSRIMAVTAQQPLPNWAQEEFAKAMESGVTDGSRPMQPLVRYQGALMAYRAKEGTE